MLQINIIFCKKYIFTLYKKNENQYFTLIFKKRNSEVYFFVNALNQPVEIKEAKYEDLP